MKTYLKSLSIAALATGFAVPAIAGGMNEPMAEPMVVAAAPIYAAPSADWTGGYVGVQLGYGDVDSDAAADALDGDGLIGGVHAGYLHDFGQFVAGIELDYDATDIDLAIPAPDAADLDSVARLKLIAGADLGQSMLYVTGGAAYADATVAGVSLSDNGYFLGIGMKYAVSEQWTVGAELLGHRFNDFDGTGLDLDATTVTARASYRF